MPRVSKAWVVETKEVSHHLTESLKSRDHTYMSSCLSLHCYMLLLFHHYIKEHKEEVYINERYLVTFLGFYAQVKL